ncbi:MAG: ATP-binding protein [Candidatus Izemoplasmatales bacterium]|nr:ATP-binding protein [Candidatus Izemoplasmatales bacterium]
MKRKINWIFISIIFFSIGIFILGATLFARNSMHKVTELNLNNYLEIVKVDYENLDETQIIDKYKVIDNYLRITFIDSQGDVIIDSLVDNLDNHLNRPEIVNIGKVYTRYSNTLKIDMMYLATNLDNGDYLRVAIPSGSIMTFLNDFVALSIVVGILILTLSIIVVTYLLNYSMKPLEEVKTILEDVNEGKFKEIDQMVKFDEISGLVSEINIINKTISENINSLRTEKNKTDFLLKHMNQGICVLDSNAKIILLNDYLKNLYNFNIDFNINKDYRYLFRDEDIQKAINEVYKEKNNINLVSNIGDKYYSVMITYTDEAWSFNSGVILIYTDITTLKNIEVLKRDFFVNASHELKSPLTTIIGSTDLIIQGLAKDKNTVDDLISRIHSEAKRMDNLVMDMLTLSEYENRNQKNSKRMISIRSSIDNIIETLRVLINESKAVIDLEVENLTIYFSEDDFYQLFKNLIENAIKYGKPNGNVFIKVFSDSDNIKFEIKDNGIGIPKSDLSRVFERFYRVDKARSKSSKGTGLGLSIVKHVVLNYNGKIELNSEENVGTEVIVTFPKSELHLT